MTEVARIDWLRLRLLCFLEWWNTCTSFSPGIKFGGNLGGCALWCGSANEMLDWRLRSDFVGVALVCG